MEGTDIIISVAGIIVASVISLAITCFISHYRCNVTAHAKASSAKILYMVLGTIALLLAMMVFLSLLCGIIAWLLYFALQNVLTLGQIKGIVDFITTVVTILSLPFFISVFWHAISATNNFRQALKDGITLNRKKYTRVLVLLGILFGIGLLVTTAFHYASSGVLADVMKILFFTVMGTVGLTVSEKIVM